MTTSATTQLIPRNVLFGNPEKTSPQVSPDGTKMAYLAPVNNVLNVWVGTIGGGNYEPVTKDEDRGVRFYFWSQDNKHIMYIQDVGGNENWRLYATSLETRETRDLTPFENVQVQIIDRDKHFPNELLIGMNKENPQVHDVYHLDLTTGELTLVTKNPGNIMNWVTDAHLKVRGAVTALPDGGTELLVRDDEHSEWRKLVTWDADDSLTSGPIDFTLDGQAIYLQDSRNVNAGRLVKLNITTGDITVIAEDPQYDVGNVIVHPDTHDVQAVAFNKDRNEWVVLDESIKLDFDNIGGIHQGDFFLISRDDADSTWLVAFTVDNGPVPFYAYDRKSQKATFLFDNQPELNKYTLATMEPISFTSRDGLTIHGYLTLPQGEQKTDLPMVLNVHGGPWGRDAWGYRPDAQWFANRGYACLQVNFRGSTGYGKNFLNAGDREWGRNMHNDLVDAVQWAIDKGFADPKKVAIFGGSYGGYAALVGATFTPDLFCCAVDIVGPSNLNTLIRTIPPYWSTFRATFYKRVGNPDTEEEFLNSRSPLFRVDRRGPRLRQAGKSAQVLCSRRKISR